MCICICLYVENITVTVTFSFYYGRLFCFTDFLELIFICKIVIVIIHFIGSFIDIIVFFF